MLRDLLEPWWYICLCSPVSLEETAVDRGRTSVYLVS